MEAALLSLVFLIVLVDWIAVARGWRNLQYAAQPAVMLALLAWLWQGTSGRLGPTALVVSPLAFFGLGLVCSLAGDVLLMLPRERFLAGLVAFLLAHVAYTAGFTTTLPALDGITVAFVLVIGTAAAGLYRRIRTGLITGGQARLQGPVAVYSGVISVMVLSALLTLVRPEWDVAHAALAGLGALLFFASDGLLAWNRFVAPLPRGRLLVIVTYHLGQIAIIWGAALHHWA